MLVTYGVPIIGVSLFAMLICQFKIVEALCQTILEVVGALSFTLRENCTDEGKERHLRAVSVRTLGDCLSILFRIALAFVLALVPIIFLSFFGAFEFVEALNSFSNLEGIILGVILFSLFALPRKRGSEKYSALEKFLHRLSFVSGPMQIEFSSVEDRLFRKEFSNINIDRPVFITSLPRAGTTLLLEIAHRSGSFVSHTYSQMPFVLLPLFWQRFSKSFRVEPGSMKRAHGDGMNISTISPEAFEEIVWKEFWPENYEEKFIKLWPQDPKPKFVKFFQRHIQKLIGSHGGTDSRYVSKNNANIARLDLLKSIFPDSQIIIPFRNFVDHCGSMLEQHVNFSNRQSHDSFFFFYMVGIGHFEFGPNQKPMNFGNWFEHRKTREVSDVNYWVEYWCATVEYLLEVPHHGVYFFDYDDFCANPTHGLTRFASLLQIPKRQILEEWAGKVTLPRKRGGIQITDSNRARAENLMRRLRERAKILTPPGDSRPLEI